MTKHRCLAPRVREPQKWVSTSPNCNSSCAKIILCQDRMWLCAPLIPSPTGNFGASSPQITTVLNFEELASPTPTLHPTKITNCVDTGPAAKMLIPKADRKAIHEVWLILTLFVAGEQQQSWERGMGLWANSMSGSSTWERKRELTFETVPLP